MAIGQYSVNAHPQINSLNLFASCKHAVYSSINQAEQGVWTITRLMLINAILLISGLTAEDAVNLESALADNAFYEPLIYGYSEFLNNPNLPSHILIGLCCLLSLLYPARRTGIYLNKTAFHFSETTISQPVQNAHGCRAPPII